MQMLGFIITDYAEEGLLGDLTPVATKEGWDKLVPAPLQKFDKYKGHWVAAPVNIHRTNWIWANKKIFDELNIAPPKTFDELMAAAEKIKKAGYIPLAHGGQPWQDATIFDSAVLSAGGPEFYRKAIIEMDKTALGSKTMEKAFEQMQKLHGLVDANYPNRDWNLATAMVINGKVRQACSALVDATSALIVVRWTSGPDSMIARSSGGIVTTPSVATPRPATPGEWSR
jgi:glucose/mannose transport system substrate-binding protein